MTTDQILTEYAEKVARGLRIKEGIDRFSHLALGLTGEAGEVADLIKKAQYENGFLAYEDLVEEMGDTLWYLQALCNELRIDLATLAVLNVRKLAKRRPQDYTKIGA